MDRISVWQASVALALLPSALAHGFVGVQPAPHQMQSKAAGRNIWGEALGSVEMPVNPVVGQEPVRLFKRQTLG
jgi:hypothetical protein